MEEVTYYFDCSRGGPDDPDSNWVNDSNAFDGSLSTCASGIALGSPDSKYLMGKGTNAVNLGRMIKSVEARIYTGPGFSVFATTKASIYTSGLRQLLGTCFVKRLFGGGWGDYMRLRCPREGWTWPNIKRLETKIYMTENISSGTFRVEVRVNYYGWGEFPFPASWLYPCIALVARGKMLDWWIYKYYKGAFGKASPDYPANPNRHNQWGSPGMVIEKIHYLNNPRTPFQQAWRDYMYFGVKNWQGFSDETKRYYNLRSKPIGDYGYHRYLSLYLKANYPPDY